jgi:hypothetical protein
MRTRTKAKRRIPSSSRVHKSEYVHARVVERKNAKSRCTHHGKQREQSEPQKKQKNTQKKNTHTHTHRRPTMRNQKIQALLHHVGNVATTLITHHYVQRHSKNRAFADLRLGLHSYGEKVDSEEEEEEEEERRRFHQK